MDVEAEEVLIGVDLGTTNYSVAIYTNGAVEPLKDATGLAKVPCFVFFTSMQKSCVGTEANLRANGIKEKYYVYEPKRFIGRHYDDETVQALIPWVPYNVERDDDQVVFVIKRPDGRIRQTPVHIYSYIFKKIKKDLEKKLGKMIKIKAVLTVPEHFKMEQRVATLEAAQLVDFQILELLYEPSATAVCYFAQYKDLNEGDHFLVYDMGGSSFSIALFEATKDSFNILSVNNSSVSGQDFDYVIFHYICDYFKNEHKTSLKLTKDMIRLLQIKSEEIKINLSVASQISCLLFDDMFPQVEQTQIKITRDLFEKLAHNLLKKTVDDVDEYLKSAYLDKWQIKKVILCGGSAKIPKIQQLLSEHFGNVLSTEFIYVDSNVAEGAARHAAGLSTLESAPPEKTFEATALSIGIQEYPNLMQVVIEKNTPIPCSITIFFSTEDIKQDTYTLNLYEGERTDSRKNRFLTEVKLLDITITPPLFATSDILVELQVDVDGSISVSAKQIIESNGKALRVVHANAQISDENVVELLQEAEANKVEDEIYAQFARRKKNLITFCQCLMDSIVKRGLTDQSQYKFCQDACTVAHLLEVPDEGYLDDLCREVDTAFQEIELMNRSLI